MRNKRPKQFSVTKAVKRNARDRVGTPPPARVLEDDRARRERRGKRFTETLAQTLLRSEDR